MLDEVSNRKLSRTYWVRDVDIEAGIAVFVRRVLRLTDARRDPEIREWL